jgi:hypothetical protein
MGALDIDGAGLSVGRKEYDGSQLMSLQTRLVIPVQLCPDVERCLDNRRGKLGYRQHQHHYR